MTYKSSTPPTCRECGKPIGKITTTYYVRPARSSRGYDNDSEWIKTLRVETLPQTREQAQKLTNQQIVSTSRDKTYDDHADKVIDKGIRAFTTWDGESYKDQFFCTGNCAQRYGYRAARATAGIK